MRKLRVFIASPEDVELERSLVSKTINLLQVEFADRVDLEQVVWELEPLLATSSFQDQIARPSSCQIAIFIFRTRFGTPLPPSYHRDDGSLYLSGTEYEFEEARDSFLKTGSPRILVYRNRKGKLINVNDDDFDSIGEQRRALDAFTKKWFVDEADNTFKGAFYQFKTSDEFERLVGSHLLKLISQLAPGQLTDGESSYRMWHRGNPFVGLNSFAYRHSAVYFGRTRAISDCVRSLEDAEIAGCPFLLVLGMSGGGKSSLVHAGILPVLTQKDVIEDVILSKWVSMRPSDVGGKLFLRLISALSDEKILPSLNTYESQDLIIMAAEEPEEFSQLIADTIHKDSDNPSGQERLILIVDQFEELFTSSNIAQDDRHRFTRLLDHLVREARVWCIITIRSDYYPTLTADPCLAALKTDGVQYDLKGPTPEEISQMIRAPAIAAGLHYEKHPDTGEALEETIRQAAEANPEILPLLEYTLSELYEHRSSNGFLTYSAYEELGGVEGALALTAERCFAKMSSRQQETLPYVFNTLIEFTSEGNIGRRWVSLDSIENEQTKAFIESFVDARLFVVELDSDQHQVVTVTHESLFRHWPRLKLWVEDNREQIRIRTRIDTAARLWVEQQNASDLLLGKGKPVDEGKLLMQSGLTVSPFTQLFIDASFARVIRNRMFRSAATALVVMFGVVTGIAAYQANLSNLAADRRLIQSEELIGFMLGDLREKLQPIGKLEILQSIGDRAVLYYRTISDEDLTDEGRIKQAQALHQIGEVHWYSGDFGKAAEAFEESVQLAEILYEDEIENTERQFRLEQAYSWLGFSLWYHGDLNNAESYFIKSLHIAKLLVNTSPENIEWQLELATAYGNLGTLATSRHDYEKALIDHTASSKVYLGLTESFSDRKDLLRELAGSYGWLGSIHRNLGKLNSAVDFFLKEDEIMQSLLEEEDNADWRFSKVHIDRHLGELFIDLGKLEEASARFEIAIASVEPLLQMDPENTHWQYGHAMCLYDVALVKHYQNDQAAAQEMSDLVSQTLDQLIAKDDENLTWQILNIKHQILLANIQHQVGNLPLATSYAESALKLANHLADINPENMDVKLVLAKAYIRLAFQSRDGASERADKALRLLSSKLDVSSDPDVVVPAVLARHLIGESDAGMRSFVDQYLSEELRHPELAKYL